MDRGMSVDLVTGIQEIVGQRHVITDPAAQKRFLEDFSWYSPMLSETLANVSVDVVAQPGSEDEIRAMLALAVRLRIPVTVRGAGTGNYGQAVPLAGGLLIDTRRLNAILAQGDESITVQAGAVFDDVEERARARSRELRLIPTTRHLATVGGFLGGGWGGIGSVAYGNLRDANVLSADLLTVEDPPRLLHLEGKDADVVIHTYGTVGVITRVTLPLAPARDWRSAFAAFPSFEAAARFAWRVALDGAIEKRLLTLQEEPIPGMFLPVKKLFRDGESAVLLMLTDLDSSRSIARELGGRLEPWPGRPMPAVTEFTWAHTILWSKKHARDSTWLQLGYSTDLDRFFEQTSAVKARFGDDVLAHLEYMALPKTGGAVAQGGHVIMDSSAEFLDSVSEFAGGIGVHVMNPHKVEVQASGVIGAIDPVIAFKRTTDPYGLLNRGKLGANV
jgi:FAD binding domain-containing protein